MTTLKNLYVPEDLLARIEAVARAQGKTADEVAEQSLRDALDFQKLLGEGHVHAKSRGFKPADVSKKIAEYRQEDAERNR
jgi:hypothetical protein